MTPDPAPPARGSAPRPRTLCALTLLAALSALTLSPTWASAQPGDDDTRPAPVAPAQPNPVDAAQPDPAPPPDVDLTDPVDPLSPPPVDPIAPEAASPADVREPAPRPGGRGPSRAASDAPGDAEALADPDAAPVLTLDAAREVLLEQNHLLQISELSVEQASLGEARALSIWIPTASVAARYTLRDQEIAFAFPNAYEPILPYLQTVAAANPALPDPGFLVQGSNEPTVVQFRHNYSVTGTLRQTLFNARAFPLMRMADLAIASARNARAQTEFELLGTLQQLYFNAVAYRRFIAISQGNVEIARLTYQQRVDALELGVGTRFEVQRAQVALSRAERELENARRAHALAVESLAAFLNIPSDFSVEQPPDLPVPQAPTDLLIDHALVERADMRALNLNIAMAEEQVDESKSTFWPVLTAQFDATFQRANAFSGNPFFWTLTMQAVWTLYDGGARDTEVRERQIAAAQARLQREQQRIQVSTQIRQAWIQVRSQLNAVETARAEVALARDNLNLMRDALELGAGSALEVELAQEQLFLSELALVDAETQLQMQLHELYRLAGD